MPRDIEKRKEYLRLYDIKHRERIKLRKKNYYIANKERIKNRDLLRKDKIIAYRKEYYLNNKEKFKIEHKKYYDSHKEEFSERTHNYYVEHKDSILENNKASFKKRYATNNQCRLASVLRHRINVVIRGEVKKGSAVKDLGCTLSELESHVESLFQPGMSWSNHGIKGWHVDHATPLDHFDLTDREQFLEACHYTNLQPMWAKENLEKGNKIINN